MDTKIQQAITILKQGGIVIYPTDTVYGIGCRIDEPSAIARLYALRRRPETQASPVLSASLAMLEPFLQPIDENVVTKLLKPYWPGALTVILTCRSEKLSPLVRGGTDTLGVRVPNHLLTIEMIEGVGVPIIGTSANFKGERTPTALEELDPELVKLVDFVVPGKCYAKEASTVIDVTNRPWKIVRQGAIDLTKVLQ